MPRLTTLDLQVLSAIEMNMQTDGVTDNASRLRFRKARRAACQPDTDACPNKISTGLQVFVFRAAAGVPSRRNRNDPTSSGLRRLFPHRSSARRGLLQRAAKRGMKIPHFCPRLICRFLYVDVARRQAYTANDAAEGTQ